jgi:large subunit ribosomal protein L15
MAGFKMDISKAKATVQPRKKKKRVGRGEGSGYGKTAGRGMNGARSRSGWSQRNQTGGNIPLWRRLPKVGFKNSPFKKGYTPVNVHQLDKFSQGTEITPQLLEAEGVVKQVKKNGIKILGAGEVTKALTVKAHAFSNMAEEKIKAAGGNVEVIQ